MPNTISQRYYTDSYRYSQTPFTHSIMSSRKVVCYDFLCSFVGNYETEEYINLYVDKRIRDTIKNALQFET